MDEIWKDIEGYEGHYQVSNLGRVRSLDRYVIRKNRGEVFLKGIILKIWDNKRGYLCIKFKNKTKNVHRLVAETFIPNINNFEQVNHIDGNKYNNNVDNLEWCTRSMNMKHAYNTGLIKTPYIGESSRNSKLSEKEVLEICELLDSKKYSHKDISEMYSVHKGTVTDINLGRSWNHLTNRKRLD